MMDNHEINGSGFDPLLYSCPLNLSKFKYQYITCFFSLDVLARYCLHNAKKKLHFIFFNMNIMSHSSHLFFPASHPIGDFVCCLVVWGLYVTV